MQDRPLANDLLAAVAEFLSRQALPELSGRNQFLARVAARTLEIVARELALEEGQLRAEWQRLVELFPDAAVQAPTELASLRQAVRQLSERLCVEIRAGRWDSQERKAAIWRHLRATVEEKLRISNPQFLAGAGSDAGREEKSGPLA